MEKIKKYINHPMSKSIFFGIVGTALLLESHALYAGMAFGVGLREFIYAFK
jgi:hypothetical protein